MNERSSGKGCSDDKDYSGSHIEDLTRELEKLKIYKAEQEARNARSRNATPATVPAAASAGSPRNKRCIYCDSVDHVKKIVRNWL
jgi:hypothetical protein